jgi:hypothetical protein
MNKYLQVLLLAFVLFIFNCPDSFSQGTVETGSFYSPSLEVTKNYYVYLPPGYNQSLDNYPVVYFFRNREHEWFEWSSLNEVADQLISSGLIGNMILVGPNHGSNRGTTEYYSGGVNMLRPDLAPVAGIGTGMFEDYIVNDIITHIDTTFRTIADKQHRGIDGFSMGGYTSTLISLRNPQVFSSIGSFEGSLMFYNLEDPNIPGPGPDDWLWYSGSLANPIFDVPRNIPYMLEHSVTNILESADTSTLNQFRSNRYHISHGYKGGATNYWRNKNFIDKLNEKGIRNSWGNPIIHNNFIHTTVMANFHATASLVKHWQNFNGTKISAPTLIDFSITESTGKNREVEVFNYGPGSITVTNVQINSAEFSIAGLPSLPIKLQPDIETLVFSINFSPTSNQSFEDTAYIYSDDPSTPLTKIILRGKGGSFRAVPGELYAASSTGLYSIDTASVSVTSIGNYGNYIDYIIELSVNLTTEELFGLGRFSSTIYDLFIINAKGGEAFSYQYDINCESSIIYAAAFSDDSLLYLVRADGNIYSLDVQIPYWAPPINLVTSTGLSSITAIAINPINGQLWAADVSGIVYKINIINGDITIIGNSGLNKMIDDIVFDSEGKLSGLVGSGVGMDTLITINTTTGIATKLGSLNTTGLYAIAISPDPPSGVIEPQDISSPGEFYITQNYPNPFNPVTTISYSLPIKSQVELDVYNVLGEIITQLLNEEKEAGRYEVKFDAGRLSSGIYFYRMKSGNFVSVKKMVLMK